MLRNLCHLLEAARTPFPFRLEVLGVNLQMISDLGVEKYCLIISFRCLIGESLPEFDGKQTIRHAVPPWDNPMKCQVLQGGKIRMDTRWLTFLSFYIFRWENQSQKSPVPCMGRGLPSQGGAVIGVFLSLPFFLSSSLATERSFSRLQLSYHPLRWTRSLLSV